MNLLEKELNKVRMIYSNPDDFETLADARLLLIKKYENKYNILSVDDGELYASLILNNKDALNEFKLIYRKNLNNKIDEIKNILEYKFKCKIFKEKRILFGLEELGESIKCISTPQEYYVRQPYYFKKTKLKRI